MELSRENSCRLEQQGQKHHPAYAERSDPASDTRESASRAGLAFGTVFKGDFHLMHSFAANRRCLEIAGAVEYATAREPDALPMKPR